MFFLHFEMVMYFTYLLIHLEVLKVFHFLFFKDSLIAFILSRIWRWAATPGRSQVASLPLTGLLSPAIYKITEGNPPPVRITPRHPTSARSTAPCHRLRSFTPSIACEQIFFFEFIRVWRRVRLWGGCEHNIILICIGLDISYTYMSSRIVFHPALDMPRAHDKTVIALSRSTIGLWRPIQRFGKVGGTDGP